MSSEVGYEKCVKICSLALDKLKIHGESLVLKNLKGHPESIHIAHTTVNFYFHYDNELYLISDFCDSKSIQIGICMDGVTVQSVSSVAPVGYSRQIEIGDVIENVDGFNACPENIDKLLKGCDVPGSILTITVRKKSSGETSSIELERLPSSMLERHSKIRESFSVCKVRDCFSLSYIKAI